LILVVFLGGSGALMRFFKLDSPGPVRITGVILAGTLFMPIVTGVLQGLQRFGWLSFSSQSWGLIRLLAGACLVTLVAATPGWALAGQALGVLSAVLIGAAGVRGTLQSAGAADRNVRFGMDRYFGGALISLFAFAVLMNTDVILVKHFFSREAAGDYAWAATIGKIVVFLPQPIAQAMFPKVVARRTSTHEHRATFFRAMVLSLLLIASGAFVCALFPRLPLFVLYHERPDDPQLLWLVRLLPFALAPLSLVFVIVNYELAQHRFRLVTPLLFCAVAFVVGAALWHPSLFHVVGWLAAAGTAAALMLGAILPRISEDIPA
jgi:O-antigen/teichoic acid export membrane protein